jgi:AcrR family transcriptional regulator
MYHLVHMARNQRSTSSSAPGPGGRSSPGARERLLDAVVEHFAADGLADQSLRQIAASVGTSHRMLLYHFRSKDGLLLEVVRRVEVRTGERLAALGGDSRGATDEVIRRMWRYVADPELADLERLFFALYGRALQGDDAAAPLLRADIETWLERNVALAGEIGAPAEVVRVHARLGLAVVRGLLLDLLATGDRAGVDAALEAFAGRYAGVWWEAHVGRAAPSGTSDRAS